MLAHSGVAFPCRYPRHVEPLSLAGAGGYRSVGSGVILFVAGAAAGVDGLWAAGMILAMTGFLLGIGQLLKLPRALWSYPILLACVAPIALFMVFIAPQVG